MTTLETLSYESWWDTIDSDLGQVTPAAELLRDPYRSGAAGAVYAVRLSSLGHYRVAGYLSVPAGSGPFPALLELPRYGGVVRAPHPHDRARYIVFTLIHRGQHRADSPFTAPFPGLFTMGIESAEDYVYRGVVADCLRAAEFLRGIPQVEPTRIGMIGDDLAVLTAARRPIFAALRVDALHFTGAMAIRNSTDSYPWEELNDLIRRHPEAEARAERTLRMLDPLRAALRVTAPVLVTLQAVGAAGTPGDSTRQLVRVLGEQGAQFTGTSRDADDADQRDAWLAARLGVTAMTRFEQTETRESGLRRLSTDASTSDR